MRFDWPALMRLGLHGLGLTPDRFWALTPAAFKSLITLRKAPNSCELTPEARAAFCTNIPFSRLSREIPFFASRSLKGFSRLLGSASGSHIASV